MASLSPEYKSISHKLISHKNGEFDRHLQGAGWDRDHDRSSQLSGSPQINLQSLEDAHVQCSLLSFPHKEEATSYKANHQEEFGLCRSQGITGYPRLMLYTGQQQNSFFKVFSSSNCLNSVSEGTKRYDGARAEEEMLKFLARFIEDRVRGFFLLYIFTYLIFGEVQ